MKTEDAAIAAINQAATELRLPSLKTQAEPLAATAVKTGLTHMGYLAELLACEVDDRNDRLRARRINEAKFPRMKRLADFDIAASQVKPTMLAKLATGSYLEAGEPVVLLGDSGTGKSHLLIGLGIAACEMGKKVKYTTCAALINELVEAADDRQISRTVARYGRLDLLCLDEVGYVHADPRGAELLFQIMTEREERASIAIASNLPFSEWGQVFPNPRLVSAVVDRVTFNAHIIETGSQSYRYQTSKRKTETDK